MKSGEPLVVAVGVPEKARWAATERSNVLAAGRVLTIGRGGGSVMRDRATTRQVTSTSNSLPWGVMRLVGQ
jgi:hypothetical protein